MKAIIFDLYDTILKDTYFDFNDGLEHLHSLQFAEECSVDDFLTFAMSFIPLYQNRAQTNVEVSFLRDEYLSYCQQLEVEPVQDLLSLEYEVMTHMQKEELVNGVKDFLLYLKNEGIKLYLMTNSIFTASAQKKVLADFGIDEYFEEIFSSADFGMRKPDVSFFEYAVNEVLSKNSSIAKEDIAFCGNDYDDDCAVPHAAGFKTFLLSSENSSDIKPDNDLEIIDSLEEIKKFL